MLFCKDSERVRRLAKKHRNTLNLFMLTNQVNKQQPIFIMKNITYKFIGLLIWLIVINEDDVSAQKTDFNKIVPPSGSRAANLEEVLVQVAWINNPRYDALESQKHIEREKVKIAKLSWTEGIAANFNLNQGNVQPTNDNIFFPMYNFSATFNLGSILKTPYEVRNAKERERIAEYEINQAKHQLRAEVLSRYRKYEAAIEVLKIRTKASEDLNTSYVLVKKSFEQGNTTLKTYIEATNAYNQSLEQKLVAESNVSLTLIALEEVIGVPLDEVKKMDKKETDNNKK